MNSKEAEQKTRAVMRMRHMAWSTENSYCSYIRRFAKWLQRYAAQLPATPEEKMERFLTGMARANYSATSQNLAFNAIRFFYERVMKIHLGKVDALRAKRPTRMRHAPSREDVRKVLSATQDSPQYPFRLILFLIYGCGLRVSEPVSIRIRDINLEDEVIVIREAKGNKDRLVKIPELLVKAIRQQIEFAKHVWARSAAMKVPVKMPNRLGRKYRAGQFQFQWFWLFPAAGPCRDPRTGATVWWHCLPEYVQRAMGRACKAAGIPGQLTPHHLRHAWATHAYKDGAGVRDIQEILGHTSLETTMVYIHPEVERVPSPIDALGPVL